MHPGSESLPTFLRRLTKDDFNRCDATRIAKHLRHVEQLVSRMPTSEREQSAVQFAKKLKKLKKVGRELTKPIPAGGYDAGRMCFTDRMSFIKQVLAIHKRSSRSSP